jgi:hypothetical protein
MKSSLRVGLLAVSWFSLVSFVAFAQSQQPRGPEPHGSNWKLFGTAETVRDPENPQNIVLRLEVVPGAASGAYRDLRNTKIWHLDHQLSFKRAFVAPHTCGAGAPRMTLFIDANGDGRFDQLPNGPDFAAHGHPIPFAACETSVPTPSNDQPAPSTLSWRFEDLTDLQLRWEVTPSTATVPPIGPIGGAGTVNWDMLEAAISLQFPNHQVLRAMLVEDATPGVTYYDLVTALELTLGTEGQEEAPNPGPRN